jgi:hypothetical protein
MGEKASLSNHRFKRKKPGSLPRTAFQRPWHGSASLALPLHNIGDRWIQVAQDHEPYPRWRTENENRKPTCPTLSGLGRTKSENCQPFATDPETRDVFHSARPLMGTALPRSPLRSQRRRRAASRIFRRTELLYHFQSHRRAKLS